MTELKPCPFCGNGAYVVKDTRGNWLAGCFNNLVCDVTPKAEHFKKDLAIEAWNKRHSPWHTEAPTEEGWYLIAFYPHNNPDNSIAYQCCEYKNGEWHEIEKSCEKFEPFIEACQKIPPFEASKEK